jgi:hypothetical protein
MRKLGLFSFSLKFVFQRAVLVSLVALAWTTFFPNSVRAQLSARTMARGLDQLVNESQLIVRGRIISASLEPHPQLRNLMTVVVTMSLSNTYKGPAHTSLVFRQYIGNVAGQGVPSEYRKGLELLLLLRPASEYGLTSPAGLEQGRFEVRTEHGRAVALNGRGNVGLFDQVAERAKLAGAQISPRSAKVLSQRRLGPMPVGDLEDLIRSLARTR